MTDRQSRYRLHSANGTPDFNDDGADDKKDSISDPDKKHTDAPDATDDDLTNVDKSKGGYGGGSGFSPDRT